MHVSLGKLLSLLVALSYVVGLVATAGGLDAGLICPCVYLLFPLALIWFPEQAGGFTGYVGRGGNIDTESPAILVSIFGWLFLIGPAVLMLFYGE